MDSAWDYFPLILDGVGTTVLVAILCILGTGAISVILGVVRTNRNKPLRIASGGITELFRGADAIIYLFWVFYALPAIPGAPQFTPIAAAVLVLSLIGGSYGAEIVRGGILAVPRSQTEACHALGISRRRTLFKVVLPQALSQIVPSFGSLAVDIVKWTSIVSFVGVQDVLYAANTARTVTSQGVEVFLFAAAVYLVLCGITALLFRGIEELLPLSRVRRARKRGGTVARAPVSSPTLSGAVTR